jgi:hypothetical protein
VILIVDSFAENARNGATKSNGTTTANGNGHADDDTEDTSDDKPDSSSGAGSRLRYILTTGNECKVNVGPELLQALSDIVGEANYDLKAAKTRRPTGQSVGR